MEPLTTNRCLTCSRDAGGSPGRSVADRASTVGVCVAVSGDVATAVNIGIQLAAQFATVKITTAASQNASLPVDKSLQHLADTISNASQVNLTDVAAVRAAAGNLGTAWQRRPNRLRSRRQVAPPWWATCAVPHTRAHVRCTAVVTSSLGQRSSLWDAVATAAAIPSRINQQLKTCLQALTYPFPAADKS